MVYQVPPSKASIKQNRFEFQMPGSRKTFNVPKLAFLKPSLVLQLETATEVEVVKALFAEYLPEAFELFADTDQLGAWFEEWQRQSGMTVGESEASADS